MVPAILVSMLDNQAAPLQPSQVGGHCLTCRIELLCSSIEKQKVSKSSMGACRVGQFSPLPLCIIWQVRHKTWIVPRMNAIYSQRAESLIISFDDDPCEGFHDCDRTAACGMLRCPFLVLWLLTP